MPFDSAPQHISPEIADQLAKMDKVIALLSEERKWCKQQLRSYDGRRCMLGAMAEVDAYGAIELKQPILDSIRQVTGRSYEYGDIVGFDRVEVFNDHPTTDHPLVLRVLHRAREIIASRATASDAGESR